MKVRFAPEHFVETDRLRIVCVLQHVEPQAARFLHAVLGMPAHVVDEFRQVRGLDLDDSQDRVHGGVRPCPAILRHASSAANERVGGAIRKR